MQLTGTADAWDSGERRCQRVPAQADFVFFKMSPFSANSTTCVEWSVNSVKSGESSGKLFTKSGILVKVLLGAFLREGVALLGAEGPLVLVSKTARVRPLLGHCKFSLVVFC